MKKTLKITKTTRLIRISQIVGDLKSPVSDEDLLDKYQISWNQLNKIYCKLFYGGQISRDDLTRRVEMRAGTHVSHIPLVWIDDPATIYKCGVCGYESGAHFSQCPRCHQFNLRTLHHRRGSKKTSRRKPRPNSAVVSGYHAGAG